MAPPRPSVLVTALAAILAGCAHAPPRPPPVVLMAAIAPAAPVDEPPRSDDAPSDVIDGLGPIHIGQPIAEIRRILGPEDHVVSVDTETHAFTSSGYKPEERLVFVLGFDQLLVYEHATPGVDLPFWKIYAKEGRVVFLILTAYGFESTPSLDRVGFPPACHFDASPRAIFDAFGEGYLVQKEAALDHATYHYLERGISVITVENAVRVFDIYGAIDRRVQDRFRAILAASAPRP